MPVAAGTKRKRGEGQWALGYREPLNKNEENKQNDDGLNVRQRIIDIYSKRGFDSIDPADLRGRMRWCGLYTQRKPGIDGGKTAMLEPEELDDRYFMLRVRIDGGRLTTRAAAGHRRHLAPSYARGTADVTDRQNIQLHWIRDRGRPRRSGSALEAVACPPPRPAATPRGSSSAARWPASPPTRSSTARRRSTRSASSYIGDAAFSNLPRKFKSAISGCPAHCAVHEINDIAFVGVVNPDGEPASTCGSAAACPPTRCSAKRLGVFVRPDEVAEVWAGVISVFRDYGYRRLRHRARIKFLVADWGPEKFREVLEKEYLGYAAARRPGSGAPRGATRDHVGVHPQKDGSYYVGFAPRVGRVDGDQLTPDRRPRRGVRLGPGAHHHRAEDDHPRRAAERVDALVAELEALGPAAPGRAPSAATRWPAPASSSASSRSSRPRRAPPT